MVKSLWQLQDVAPCSVKTKAFESQCGQVEGVTEGEHLLDVGQTLGQFSSARSEARVGEHRRQVHARPAGRQGQGDVQLFLANFKDDGRVFGLPGLLLRLLQPEISEIFSRGSRAE